MADSDATLHRESRPIEVCRIPGLTPYAEGLALQMCTRNAVEAGDQSDTLILLEHTPVITLGRSTDEKHLLKSRSAFEKMGIDVCEVDRGGDVTYHGPGQLVAYPIINLTYRKQSVGWYLRRLEETLIRTLQRYQLTGVRVEGMTGVWVNDAKIAAVGVGVRNWITYHGISLNINPSMEHFESIIPCGIANKSVTSLHALLNEQAPNLDTAAENYANEFQSVFSFRSP